MGNTPPPDNRIVWNALSKKVGVKTQGTEEEPQQWYKFDEVFGASTTQIEVYCRLASPILDEVFSGCKCTVIAYGPMGTGKTHTMMGEGRQDAGFTWCQDSQAGIIPRFIHHIFERLPGSNFSVKLSLFEIDNEDVLDLLSGDAAVLPNHLQLCDDPKVPFPEVQTLERRSPHPKTHKGLPDSRDSVDEDCWALLQKVAVCLPTGSESTNGALSILKHGQRAQLLCRRQYGAAVRGLREVTLRNADEAYPILERGFARRKTARTPINDRSSRSHVVLKVTIWIKEIEADRTGRITTGTLNLVDLASSEDFKHYRVPDVRAQEAEYIHQSLLALGRVITALAEKRPHVPYRDSILTRVLQDSLGGTTKSTIIATVPWFSSDLEGTRITLKYASKARNIINKPEVDQTVREWVPMERPRALYFEEMENLSQSPYGRLL